jgi:hypothetical protein
LLSACSVLLGEGMAIMAEASSIRRGRFIGQVGRWVEALQEAL